MTCLVHWWLAPYRPRDCAEVHVRVGVQRSSQKGDIMAASSIRTLARESLGWLTTVSVLMIIAGILAIVVPPAAGIAVAILVGWLLVFSGGAHLAFAWRTRGTGGFL